MVVLVGVVAPWPVVVTGSGNDFIMAGNGDNLIAAGLGRHTVLVGSGSNILIDGSGSARQCAAHIAVVFAK